MHRGKTRFIILMLISSSITSTTIRSISTVSTIGSGKLTTKWSQLGVLNHHLLHRNNKGLHLLHHHNINKRTSPQ